MGGLSYFFEEEGIPTTQISLIRRHTELIKPPRALWVAFELGRPLGIPGDPAFQRRVLYAALSLLEAPSGPVLEDYPEDAPSSHGNSGILACPVNFNSEEINPDNSDQLSAALKKEMISIRPWYDIGIEKRGRTTVGVSGIDIEQLADFICSFLTEKFPESLSMDIPLPYVLNFATDDLKAFYNEAMLSQPGQGSLSSEELSDWFWGETVASKVLLKIREKFSNSKDRMMKMVSGRLIVPIDQAHRGV